MTFKIDKPLGTSATNRRSPQYLSPATSQIAINVEQNGTSIAHYVAEIAAPYTGAITQIANGIAAPKKLLVYGAGDLFVMTNTGYVLEYAPPYTGTPVTIGNGVALSSMVLTP